ncbi:MAG TPA: hypothetical protein PLR20_10640 [Syntrophales bacterium]|nr:hypothetical protein [Syntrophales bacterium]HOX94521.1 hypothetical protein [Syntrophales bacterium]HPI57508.1 hypothetical protein [Syntrophales bacterium]HPN24665.1 hypothetical protein [Syntrophales bacterium]HQM29796.1 hypothetical protein [Syntrophales bacterium]
MVLFVHGGFMAAGFFLMAAGFAVARFMRKKRFWLRAHRALGLSGASLIGLGFLTALYMVNEFGDEHFAVLHARVGALTVFLSFMTPALGQLQIVFRSRAADIRNWHRWSGAMTLLMVFLTILTGLVQAGVLPDLLSF